MCGIFAYAGHQDTSTLQRILEGLRRLEYRGYDSWGVALMTDNTIRRHRQVGTVSEIIDERQFINARIGVGHTRWATHGGVNWNNAHPHLSSGGDFALVHNGIVENYQPLKQMLLNAGHSFESETDSEVIVRLIEEKLRQWYQSNLHSALQHPLRTAVTEAFQELDGHNTIMLIANEDDCLIGVRNGSPLVVGYGAEELYIASDPLSFSHATQQVSFVEDMQLIEYRGGRLIFYDVTTGDSLAPQKTQLEFTDTEVCLGDYPHYMLKEILEQPQTLQLASQIDTSELNALADAISEASQVITVGAGGAYYAAEQITHFLRSLAGIPTRCIAAYEMENDAGTINNGDVVIAVSQSGETADTLDAVRLAQHRGARIASIVNMPGSTLSRLSDYAFYSNAGPEICVLSTKSSTAQMVFGYILGHYLNEQLALAKDQLSTLQTQLQTYLSDAFLAQIKTIAQQIQQCQHLFILGKSAYRINARIGALNIKEASYIHAEAFAAGELKHGVIALIEEAIPVIVFVDENNRDYMLNATAEVKSRGAYVIGIADQINELFDAYIPLVNTSGSSRIISSIIPCQLLAYFLSTLNGHNPDRPRNLAKSVTVR